MKGKELIRDMINTYFMLVAMITVVMAILGSCFLPEIKFGYESFFTPLIYAAYVTLPNIVMYSKKELNLKQFLLRKILQLILVEIIVIAVALPIEIIESGNSALVISLVSCVFMIYVLSHAIEWYQNSVTAKKMTEELVVFQKKYEQG